MIWLIFRPCARIIGFGHFGATIRRAEARGEQATRVTDGSMLVIERAFREAGVVFLEEDGEGGGALAKTKWRCT